MRIDRCVCFERTFEELKEVADKNSAHSLTMLQKHVDFGQKCELCHPYVRRMLKTGETWFDHIIAETEEPD